VSKQKPKDPFRDLTKARKAKGLSAEDVAIALHLTTCAVEEIEKGNWAYFPKGPYFQGYLKRFCEYLNIPCQPLLDAYQAQYCNAEICDYQEPKMHKMKLTCSYQHKKYRTVYGLACAFMVFVLVGVVSTKNILSGKTVADSTPIEPNWLVKNQQQVSTQKVTSKILTRDK
jgi:cytoskeletal protein RodZ